MCFKTGGDFKLFSSRAREQYRYFQDPERKAFLDGITATAASRKVTLTSGSRLWRAQLGMDSPTETNSDDGSVTIEFRPHPKRRMLPLPGMLSSGRANTPGIPVLYTSTNPETAMSEVRPNKASQICLAELTVTRDVTIVDCSIGNGRSIFEYAGTPVAPDEREGVVWRSVNDAFTRPVDTEMEVLAYVATQILAEHFKGAGYDGIRYRSGYDTGGHNVILFDTTVATVGDPTIYRVRGIQFDFESW